MTQHKHVVVLDPRQRDTREHRARSCGNPFISQALRPELLHEVIEDYSEVHAHTLAEQTNAIALIIRAQRA